MIYRFKKYTPSVWLVAGILYLSVFNLSAQVYLNEFLASNSSVIRDDEYSGYSDWLELYNEGTRALDLSGYSLSDDTGNRGKWLIPPGTTIQAKGFLLIWADGRDQGLHTNFKLGSSGEQLCLTDTEGEIIDSLTYGEQTVDVSCGRDPADGKEWLYFSVPTPGTANTTPGTGGPVSKPISSIPGGFYNGSQTVTLSSDSKDAVIRFTLDGSEPSANSAIYTGPIPIDETTIIRTKSFREANLPSKTVTNTYFIDEGVFTLPVISISVAPADLWDDDIGIYVEGNGDCDCGMSLTGNYCCRDCEKPVGI